MKKLGGVLLVLILTAASMPVLPAQAAACTNVSSFGSVVLNVPELPNDDSRVLWVRLQTTGPEATVLAEVNRNDCMEIKAQGLTPGQWVWAARQSDGRPVEVSFPSRQGNTLRLFGVTDGLRLDRVLLTEASCIPADLGNNCQSAFSLEQGSDGAPVLVSPSNSPVSGVVMLSQTPEQNRDRLSKVEYIVNGTVLQTLDRPNAFDTTLVANGKYTVDIHTFLVDGEVIRESAFVDIQNAENFLSPLVRWARLHMRLVRVFLASAGALLLLFIVVVVLRGYRKQSRERQFRGF